MKAATTALTKTTTKNKKRRREVPDTEETSAFEHDTKQPANHPTGENKTDGYRMLIVHWTATNAFITFRVGRTHKIDGTRLRSFIGQPRTHCHRRVRTTAPTPRKHLLPRHKNPPFLPRQETLPSYLTPRKPPLLPPQESLPSHHAKKVSTISTPKNASFSTTPRKPPHPLLTDLRAYTGRAVKDRTRFTSRLPRDRLDPSRGRQQIPRQAISLIGKKKMLHNPFMTFAKLNQPNILMCVVVCSQNRSVQATNKTIKLPHIPTLKKTKPLSHRCPWPQKPKPAAIEDKNRKGTGERYSRQTLPLNVIHGGGERNERPNVGGVSIKE